MSQAQLARAMGKTPMWVSLRLRGMQPIDLNDLLLFARALDVQIHDLMPPPEVAAMAEEVRNTARYPTVTEQCSPTDRPRDNRPNGRPAITTGVSITRTGYLNRPGRRRRDR